MNGEKHAKNNPEQNPEPWLVRPESIRGICYGSVAVLVIVVLLETVVPIKGYFTIDNWHGFGAVFGFLSCLIMVLVAKGLGLLLKRPQDYYLDIPAEQEQEKEKEQEEKVDV